VRISELARRAGTTAGAIRFYERSGVLPPAGKRANGYRSYGEADLCRLRVLVSLRGLGLPLDESSELAAMCAAGRCDDMASDLRARIVARRAELAAARAELDHVDGELANLERALDGGEPQATLCLERRDPDAAALRLPVRS